MNLERHIPPAERQKIKFLMTKSKFFGFYFTRKYGHYFGEGDLVSVYAHRTQGAFTLDQNKNLFEIDHGDFGTIFFTKEEWRNKKINQVLQLSSDLKQEQIII